MKNDDTIVYKRFRKNSIMDKAGEKQITISYDDFSKVEIRVGTIIDVQDFPEARRPAYRL